MPGGVLSGSELMFRVTQAWLEMGLEGKKKSRNAGSKKSHSALSDSLWLQLEVEEAGGGKPSHPDLQNPFPTHHLFNFPHLFANFNSVQFS